MTTIKESGVVRIKRQGPPSVLEFTTEIVGQPAHNQVLIRQESIGLNYVDTMFRSGVFPLSTLPATIGVEAAGVVEAVGLQVQDFKVGDHVAYYFSLGAYAERRLINAREIVKVPSDISFDHAASLMAKGLTARMLIKQAYPVKEGDTVLVHAAAGGVGSLISALAKSKGATVIGTVGNVFKKEIALKAGLDHVIATDTEDFPSAVRSITNGKGVNVVYDGVGASTFDQSIDLILPGGSIILYGASSGAPQINQTTLQKLGISFLRPSLGNYLPDRPYLELATAEVFSALRAGVFGDLKPTVYSLADAEKAHSDLESRKTTGPVVFHP
ncbi:quinone oxidoreductase [Mucilaginibacter gynuensis]|uniref:Quinone oxidoreductase n=1 Tax=Mucilaginibacter gynuensis TaxID=1302236 RepID=A0ABP8HGU8_9SPHI